MFELICVTSRKMCGGSFFKQLEKILSCRPDAVILREKDLTKEEYLVLAKQAVGLCRAYHVPCVLHNFAWAALMMDCDTIHLPLPVLRQMTDSVKKHFCVLGASCHSREDALEAERLGCTYITAGHIFPTDSKRGVPARGIAFLQDICGSVRIPVYAIGGMKPENIKEALEAGAAGACIMGDLMRCADVGRYFEEFRKAGEGNAVCGKTFAALCRD